MYFYSSVDEHSAREGPKHHGPLVGFVRRARAGPDTLHQGGGAPAPPPAARHLRHSVLNLLKIYASHDMNVFLDIQENVM